MSAEIFELKAKIYDEVLKHKVAERNIAILEGQLQKMYLEPIQVSDAIPEIPSVPLELPHNNT